MSNVQAIADRIQIEALCGEFTDAVMMRAAIPPTAGSSHSASTRSDTSPAPCCRVPSRPGAERGVRKHNSEKHRAKRGNC